jgi:hypothetical protein
LRSNTHHLFPTFSLFHIRLSSLFDIHYILAFIRDENRSDTADTNTDSFSFSDNSRIEYGYGQYIFYGIVIFIIFGS